MAQHHSEFADYCCDLLSPFGQVTARSMFGGYGLYKDGIMFGLIAYDVLYFKANNETKDDYLAYGCGPFEYHAKDKVSTMSYYQVPSEVMENHQKLKVFMEKAYRIAVQSKKKK